MPLLRDPTRSGSPPTGPDHVGRSDPVDQRDHRCSWRDVEGGLGEHPRLERRVVGGDELDLDDVLAGSCRPSAETTGLGRVFACIAGLGALAERVYGHGRWLLLYFGCGVVGQAFGYLWAPPDAGASVAAAGLLGAACAWLLSPAGPRQAQVRVWGWS